MSIATSPMPRTVSGNSQGSKNKYLLNESKSAENNWAAEQILGHMK